MIVRCVNRLSGALLVALMCVGLSGCATSQKTSTTKSPGKAKSGKASTKVAGAYPETSEEALQSYAHFATALSLDMRDDPASALEEYVKAAEANPKEEALTLDVARRLLRTKQGDKAIALLSKSAAQPGSSGLVHSWLGLAYASTGETNKAVNANRTAIQKMPGQISAYANLCDLYLALGKTNEVVALLNDAGKQNNAPVDFYVNLADVLRKMQGRDVLTLEDSRKRILAALEKAAALKPDDLLLQQRMADSYLFAGEAKKAEEIVEKLYADH